MGGPDFDFEGMFDADYLRFTQVQMDEARSRSDADVIARLGNLAPGAEVLDAPCGHGRISNLLAQDGYAVTGLDASELFLEHARADAETRGVNVTYVTGDLRDLPYEDDFDALVNWFSSFGYWDDATNRQVLAGFHRALRPGGLLLLEQINPYLVIRLQSAHGTTAASRVGDDLMVDRNYYDLVTGIASTERTIWAGGQVRETRFGVRMMLPPEWTDWLHAAGFREVTFHGDAGAPMSLGGSRMVIVARA